MDDYVFERSLGKGSFGQVSVVRCLSDGQQYVLKQINLRKLTESERESALNEAKLLSELSHPCIVAYKHSELIDNKLNIIMEYCEKGDINQYISVKRQNNKNNNKSNNNNNNTNIINDCISEDLIIQWFIQIALALYYIHHIKKILHRDLKAANLFINNQNHIKLGDFGISKILNNDNDFAETLIGTPYYLAPEICEGKHYNYKSDIWSFGCVLYELTTLKHAFDGKTLPSLVMQILSGVYAPIPNIYTNELAHLIDCMLIQDPTKRPHVHAMLKLDFVWTHIERLIVQRPELTDYITQTNANDFIVFPIGDDDDEWTAPVEEKDNTVSVQRSAEVALANTAVVLDESTGRHAKTAQLTDWFERMDKAVEDMIATANKHKDETPQHQLQTSQLLVQLEPIQSAPEIETSIAVKIAANPKPKSVRKSGSASGRGSNGVSVSSVKPKRKSLPVSPQTPLIRQPQSPQKLPVKTQKRVPSQTPPPSQSARRKQSRPVSPIELTQYKPKVVTKPASPLSTSTSSSTPTPVQVILLSLEGANIAARAYKEQRASERAAIVAVERERIQKHKQNLRRVKAKVVKERSAPQSREAIAVSDDNNPLVFTVHLTSALTANTTRERGRNPSISRTLAAADNNILAAAKRTVTADNVAEVPLRDLTAERRVAAETLKTRRLQEVQQFIAQNRKRERLRRRSNNQSDIHIVSNQHKQSVITTESLQASTLVSVPLETTSFVVNNNAVSRDNRLQTQIDTLRQQCTDLLGNTLFMRVYGYIKELSSPAIDAVDLTEEEERISAMETVVRSSLAAEQLVAMRLVQKLVYCESMFYS